MDESYLDLLMAQQDEVSEAEGGGGGVWVVADVTGGILAPVTLEAVGAARTLADSLGAYVYGVLMGSGVSDLAQTMYQAGADGVRVADDPSLADFGLESYLAVLAPLFAEEQPEVVIFGATRGGKEMSARLAQRMGGGMIENVTAVSLDEATRAVQGASPIYGGEYFEIEACPEARPQFLTVEPGALPSPFLDSYRKGEPTAIEFEPAEPAVRETGPAEGFEPPPIPLAKAPVIVTAGRQAGDLTMVQQLAEALGGKFAGDRGARDAGLIELDQMVDVRGTTVAPELYVAVGVRGDTFHNAAMDQAKFIVAVHPDPDAPIFQIADLCIEADPQEVLPHLLAALG
jgi:electron transfer flavoprotein alpha subunit